MQLKFIRIFSWLLCADLGLSTGDVTERPKVPGYDCGHVFFPEAQVISQAEEGFELRFSALNFPKIYNGPMYAQEYKHYLWPLCKFKNKPDAVVRPYYVVFSQEARVVDVVAQMMNKQLIKCLRVNAPSEAITNHANAMLDGYQCASRFFSHEHIIKCAQNIRQWKSSIPYIDSLCKFSPYKGFKHLFCSLTIQEVPGDSSPGYNKPSLLPSSSSPNEPMPKSVRILGPYKIVMNILGDVVDVVAVLIDGNFISCPRAKNENRVANVIKPVPIVFRKNGYQCGKQIFYDDYLANVCKYLRNLKNSKNLKNEFPKLYAEPETRKVRWIWPLLEGNRIFSTGRPQKYYVILSREYEVVRVVDNSDGIQMKECPRIISSIEGQSSGSNGQENSLDFTYSIVKAQSKAPNQL